MNDRFLCSDPKLNEIKIRLYDKDRQCTKEYTLSKLIYTKFKRNKFEYRGMSTGLRDKNGNLIYEGDVVDVTFFDGGLGENGGFVEKETHETGKVAWQEQCGMFVVWSDEHHFRPFMHISDPTEDVEIIGNIHEQAEQKDVK